MQYQQVVCGSIQLIVRPLHAAHLGASYLGEFVGELSALFLVDDRVDPVGEFGAVSEGVVRELLSDRAGLIAQLVAWQSDAYYCFMRS